MRIGLCLHQAKVMKSDTWEQHRFLLSKRGRGKQDWWDDDVQIRLEAEVRRLQENTGGRVATNSLSAQRKRVLSNTEGRVSLQPFYLSGFHSFYIVCLVGLLLAAHPYQHTPGRADAAGVLGPHWGIFHMGLSFGASMTPAGYLHPAGG